ncbi:MAG: hypothetical protein JSV56_09885 [Methanomassiliicoccales archaeon]|nr:MAG: hypothetical protein JSV56_09885 [Methanomassiliicoccales archaeon]
MLEKRVIDNEGIELGVVSKVEDNLIEVSEGLFDELLLNKSYIKKEEEEEVILKDSVQNLLEGLKVKGSDEKEIGTIKETVSAGDVLDTLIIETEEKNLLFITLEEIYKIDDTITLDIDLDEVTYRQKTHTLMDHIRHYMEKKRSH